ncbi:hypothetical protein AVEN_117911-1 [Araneus ventricosus]|uniref:Peptidase aspartic putative domain-containing protein n=1 Tax=Araneus ventricosus TaxID=182803 RepID=A0A4Y2JCU5_ARAVE|nr:hypothetical protein AVEN_117911-1 [Araneus ventricosus]
MSLISRHDPKQHTQIEVLITDTLSGGPIQAPNEDSQKIMQLPTDPGESHINIDVLIGAGVFWTIVDASGLEKINSLTCVATIFGSALQGKQESLPNTAGLSASFLAATADVQILWELDSLGMNDRGDLSRSDKSLIDLFERDLKYENGRYETKLLWNVNPEATTS